MAGGVRGGTTRRTAWRAALAALLLTMALSASGQLPAAPARAATNPPRPDPGGANGQSFLDGCTRDPGNLIDGAAPEWVYVYNTPASQPPPPPRWVAGTVTSLAPHALAVHPAGDDLPAGHDDYDLNTNIIPDPAYDYLVSGHIDPTPGKSTGNFASPLDEAYAAVHSEREGSSIPRALWPEAGDRIQMLGSWVWDCGHWGVPTNVFSPDYILPKVGEPCLGSLASFSPFFDPSQCTITGESTEFHPYQAMWDVAARPDSAEGEAEAKLYVSTDLTRAGLIAECAHQNPPPMPGVTNPQLRVCIQNGALWQDVTGDYSFFLPAPPKPSAHARLTYRVVDAGSAGAPPPTLTPQAGGVQVTFHLVTVGPGQQYPAGQQLEMAYRIYAGWDTLPASQVPAHLRVSLDRLVVHRAMDPGCPRSAPIPGCADQSTSQNQSSSAPGEWNMFFDAQGEWVEWGNGEFDPTDGTALTGNQAIDLYVPPGAGVHLVMFGRECDLQALAQATGVTGKFSSCAGGNPGAATEIADSNDLPGTIEADYPSVQAALGTHVVDGPTAKSGNSSCPDSNVHGCYTLTYSVSAIADDASRVLSPAVPNTGAAPPYLALALAAVMVPLLGGGLALARRRPRR